MSAGSTGQAEGPERIWLAEERYCVASHEVGPWNETTEGTGTPYVRADLYDAAQARIAELEAALAGAREALVPFDAIGQWLFARPVPDEEVMVEGVGINGHRLRLIRGDFKAASTATRAMDALLPQPKEPSP